MKSIILITNNEETKTRLPPILKKEKFMVECSSCATLGLELSVNNKADVILIEPQLEDLDIFEILEIKRLNSELSCIPLVILSTTTKNVSKYFEAGSDDFISLSSNLEQIPYRIKALTKRFSISKGVSGNFSHINILELIQLLINASRDGVLEITTKEIRGTLYFKNGQVFNASAIKEEDNEPLKAEEAFLTLLREAQNGGEFTFDSTLTTEPETNIEKRTDHLLLGLANILDEEN